VKDFHTSCIVDDGICRLCHNASGAAQQAAEAAIAQAEAIHAVEHAEEDVAEERDTLSVLDIGWLMYKPDTELMPMALVQGCMEYMHQLDWPHWWDMVPHAKLKNVLLAAKHGQLDRLKPKYGLVHAVGGPGVDDHFASIFILPDAIAVADPLYPEVHPGLEAALRGLGAEGVRIEGGKVMSVGVPCWHACLENFLSCLLYGQPCPERTLFLPGSFDTADTFRTAVQLARAHHAEQLSRADEADRPVNPTVQHAPVRNDSAEIPAVTGNAVQVDTTNDPPVVVQRAKRSRGVTDSDPGEEALRPLALPPTPAQVPRPPPPRAPIEKEAERVETAATYVNEEPAKTVTGGATKPQARFHRAKGEAIKTLTPAVVETLPPGFIPGSHYLRRAPMTQEAALKITNDRKLLDLLMLPLMVLPSQPSLVGGIEDETRRRHLYAWKDVMDEVVKLNARQESLQLAIINAIDSLATNRKWAPTTKSTNAAAIYGCLQRLDTYSNLGYTIELEDLGSQWKDASKKWMKEVCGHSPQLGEVTAAGMMEILKPGRTSLPVAVLFILCWSSTGRPFNWLYVKKQDLIIEDLDKSDDPGHNLKITWRDHKTVDKRGAFTVPSWLPKEWGTKVKKWLQETRGEWVFPKSLWESLKLGLRSALKEASSLHGRGETWDLKALRRGSLSTMARNGVSLTDLRLFSGHKSDAMLLRYLGWGVHAAEQAARGHAAARQLHK
jgi:hypothetical protein